MTTVMKKPVEQWAGMHACRHSPSSGSGTWDNREDEQHTHR